MADLLMEIEAEIAAARAATAKQNVGVIREIADGVARIEGLTEAMLNKVWSVRRQQTKTTEGHSTARSHHRTYLRSAQAGEGKH